jgi:hypothetical protein
MAARVDMLKGSNNFEHERQQLHRECIDAYDDLVTHNAEGASE